MIYTVDGEIRQNVAMKLNEGFSFPEKIRIVRAELYTFNRKKREKVWKDGTGKVSRDWSFPTWMKIWDDEGDSGEGPVSPEVVKTFLPMLLQDKEHRTNLDWRKLFFWKVRAKEASFGAIYQAETLLLDLIAKKRNVPLYKMLGAERDWCDCYKGGGSVLRTDEELVEELCEIKNLGFRGTKFKIGIADVDRDLRRLEKVREALGPDFSIAVDGNQGWDAETAMQFIRGAKQFDVAWYEEPVEANNMEEIAKLVQMMKDENCYIPLAFGESINTFATFRNYVDAGVEVIQPKPFNYCIAESLRIADYARSRNCRITSGQGYNPGCLMGTLLKPGELIEFHKPNCDYVDDYYSVHSELKDGRMYLPDIPGLPVRVNFEKLKADGCLSNVQYFYA
jgi:L-alanine-DL-glutamate epimerase-like enolase superfamily enzyme